MSSAASCRIGAGGAGQANHDLRIGPQPQYVDLEKSHLNRLLIAYRDKHWLREEWLRIRAAHGKTGKLRKDQNLDYAGIITFGHDAQPIFSALTIEAQDAAYRELALAIAEKLNTVVTGLVVHCDESAPHAHFKFLGIDRDGRPLSYKLKAGMLAQIQNLTAEVMGCHAPGITRGKKKLDRIKDGDDPAKIWHRSVAELQYDMPREHAEKRAALDELGKKIALNEERAAKARAKAEASEADAERALKRAETYERRAEKARQELEVAQRTLDNLAAREDALARSEDAMGRREEWLARGANNLEVAMRMAASGQHDRELTAADMAEALEQFKVLRQAAPEGRPTWGWRCRFWSLHYSNTGQPVSEQHLSAKLRDALTKAFDRVAAWAGNVAAQAAQLTAREQKVAQAEKAADECLRNASRKATIMAEKARMEALDEVYAQSLVSHREAIEHAAFIIARATEKAAAIDPGMVRQQAISAFNVLRDIVQASVGGAMCTTIGERFDAAWARHPDNRKLKADYHLPPSYPVEEPYSFDPEMYPPSPGEHDEDYRPSLGPSGP